MRSHTSLAPCQITSMHPAVLALLASFVLTAAVHAQEREAPPAGPEAVRFRVVVEAPGPYRKMLEEGLDLARWQRESRVTMPLLERLVAEARKATAEARAGLWHKISGPLSTVLMPLLAAIAAFGLARSGHVLLRATVGMALGFTYFVADNFSLAMGNVGAYPPILAAWAPFFLFLLVGETVLIRSEE